MKSKIRLLQTKWNDSGLQLKIVIVFILTISVIVFTNLILYLNINSMLEQVDRIYVSNVTLQQLSDALEEVQSSMTDYLDTKSSDALDSYYRCEQEYRKVLNQLNGEVSGDKMLITEKNIKSLSENYLELVDETITAKRGRDVELYKVKYQIASEKNRTIEAYIYSLNEEQFSRNAGKYVALISTLKQLEMVNIFMLAFGALFDILFIYILIGDIIRPLKNLSDAARDVAAGDFTTKVTVVEAKDEVGILSRTFNQMIQSIEEYVERLRESMATESAMKERELMMEGHLKDAQLKYLQAQINPHFLFNTLNAGAQLAMMEGADKTVSFIENMADFFRYNIKKINEDTTIGEELKMVDSYIYILNVRFSGEIHYKKQVAEELEDVKVPSMILQPIVENAVNYGIRGLEREGIIEVSVYRDEPTDSICISVWDNGHGMTQERIQEVMEGRASENASSSNSNGIGLENVITRLQLYFDCDPGNHESEMRPEDVLTMQSDGAEQGTEVTIWIPNNH